MACPTVAKEHHEDDGELIVIGAGQMRTGTMSTHLALERLLGKPCYHMKYVIRNQEEAVPKWIKAFDRNGNLTEEEWREIFRGYLATVDNPGCQFYKELMEVFPNAKVLLNVRDADAWVKSIRQTTVAEEWGKLRRSWFGRYGIRRSLFQLLDKKFLRGYPSALEYASDQEWKDYFNRWNEEVIRYVPKDRLLVFRVEEGWGPLCRFLQVPEPVGEPFPRVNDSAEFKRRTARMIFIKNVVYAAIAVGLAAASIGVVAWFYAK